MPEGLIAVLPALIGAGTAATGIGLQASGALSPSTSGQVKQQELLNQEEQQKQQQTSEQALFKRFAPDAQANTGGSLSDTSLAALITELSGNPGDIGLAQQTVFGNSPGLTTTSPGLG